MVDGGDGYLGGGVVREETVLAGGAVRICLRFDPARLSPGEDSDRALEDFTRRCDVYASIAAPRARGVAWMRVCARDETSLTVEGSGSSLGEDIEPTPEKLEALLATVYWSLRDAHEAGLGAVGRIDPRSIRFERARARREYQIEPCFGWVQDTHTATWREPTAHDELAAIGRLVFEVAANRPEVPRVDRQLRVPFPAGHRVWRFLSEGDPQVEDLWRRQRCEELVAWMGDASLEAIEDRMPARPRRLRPPPTSTAGRRGPASDAADATGRRIVQADASSRGIEDASAGAHAWGDARRGWVIVAVACMLAVAGGGAWYLATRGGSGGSASSPSLEEGSRAAAGFSEQGSGLGRDGEGETEHAGEVEPGGGDPDVSEGTAEAPGVEEEPVEVVLQGGGAAEVEGAGGDETPVEPAPDRRRLFARRVEQARQSMDAALAGLEALGLDGLPLREAWGRRLEEIRARHEANADGDALEREADDLLQQVRDAIDQAYAGSSPAELLGHDLRPLVLARRRDALHVLLEAGGFDLEGEAVLTVDDARDIASWTAGIERFGRAIEDVRRAWKDWYLLNETFDTPEGSATLLARLDEAKAALEENAELKEWVRGLAPDDEVRRLLALGEVAEMYGNDASAAQDAVRRVLGDPASFDPRVLQSAWFSPVFASTYPDASERLSLSVMLLNRLRSVSDVPRRDALEARWHARAEGLWNSAWTRFLREHADDDLDAWVAQAREFGGLHPDGGMPSGVAQRIAYNEALLAARTGVHGARDRALTLADELEAMAIDDAGRRRQARDQARALREVVARADRASQSLLLPTLEQGGWRVEGDPLSGRFEAVHDASGQRMAYVRLSGTEPPVFLSEREVSIGQVVALLATQPELLEELGGEWRDFDALMSGETARIANQPLRSWIIEGGAMRPVGGRDALVVRGYSSRAYVETIRVELFEEPDAGWPMNDISAEAASRLAERLFSGRLPTGGEFRRALEQAGLADATNLGLFNLRDGGSGGFARQQEFSDRARASDPDLLDAFYLDNPDLIANRWLLASGEIRPGLRSEARYWPGRGDDGVTLFARVDAPVVPGDALAFVHLIGNVGEWVTLTDGTFAVAGGSALSAPEIGVVEPARPRAFRGSGWFDIGFRVAIEGVTQVASDGGRIEQEIIDAIGGIQPWTD